VKGMGDFGQVEAATNGLAYRAQLLEVHLARKRVGAPVEADWRFSAELLIRGTMRLLVSHEQNIFKALDAASEGLD